MLNFRSVVERTVHLQLQWTHFQTPAPLFAALVVLSVFPVVGHAATLATSLIKSSPPIPEGVPFLKSLFSIFTRALNTACLGVRIHVKVPIQWRQLLFSGPPRGASDDVYATPRAEAKYWRVAGRYRRRLYSGSTTTACASRDDTAIPLVTYYTPRLLPLYRERNSGGKRTSRETDVDAQESRVSPKTFCKWHRMVFQDSCHPTLAQAAVWMKDYSNRDLGEIQRIARLLPDEQVFHPKGRVTRKACGTTKYSEMWQSWLDNKGMDVVILFE